MKKKKLQALYDHAVSEREQWYNMLQSRLQIIALTPEKVALLMNMTLEALYYSRLYGGYADADPGKDQWIAGPVRIVLMPA